jgi:CHAT domain-containing protein
VTARTGAGTGVGTGAGTGAAATCAAAFLAVAVSACGLVPPERRSDATGGDQMRAVADKASRLSELEQQAYQRNTLLQFSAAEQDYRETLGLARELFPTDPARASNLRLHLALNKSNLGQFESAESLFERSREIVEELGAPSDRAKPDLFYAQHLMNLNQFASAEETARRAEAKLTELIADMDEGGAAAELDRIGLVQSPDGALLIDEARANILNAQLARDTDFEESGERLTERQRLQLQRVQAIYITARALRGEDASGDEAEALILRAEADLAQIPEAFGRWLRAEIASLRADRLQAEGRPAEAIVELDAAIELLRKYEVGSRPEALLLFRKGELEIANGRPAEGEAAFRRALEIIRDDAQGMEVAQARAVVERLLDKARAGDAEAEDQLFLLMQKVRSPATAQTVAQLSARLASGDDARAQALRELQDLEREANVLAARFDRLEADANADLHYRRVTEAKLNDVRGGIAARRQQLGEIAPNYDQLIDAVIPLADAQGALGPGEVMAVVQLGVEKGLVGILTDRSFDAYEIPLNIASAEEAVRALRTPIDGEFLQAFDLERGYEAYETIFGPARATVAAADHLIVVPSGPLLSLPFNVLVTEPHEDEIQIVGTDPMSAYFDYSDVKWLGARSGITTGVSISSFFLGRQTPLSDAPEPFRGFGDFVRFGQDPGVIARIAENRGLPESCRVSVRALGLLNELPGTRGELEKVQAVLGVPDEDIVLGPEFTDAAVQEMELDRYKVLHFATHGLLAQDPECLPEPGLVTSLGPRGDGLLEASEIVDLQLDAELVVMSACDTGAGAGQAASDLIGFRGAGGSYAAGGESLNGLARSFFFAGARNVVSTHWSVDDRATQELMVGFYRAAAGSDGATIAEALRQSEVALIEGGELSHPFFWAPFAIIGDGARRLRLEAGPGATAGTPALPAASTAASPAVLASPASGGA